MAEIRTVTVIIERTVVQAFAWDIDMGEFAEWSSKPEIDVTDPQTVKEFIEAGRFYNDAIRDRVLDAPAGSWADAFSEPEAHIEKVVIL